MAINVRCECGARVVVGDNKAGRTVSCRQCDADVQIPLPDDHNEPAPDTIACDACAEEAPFTARKCPHCGEKLPDYEKRARKAGIDRECDYCGETFERALKKCPHCGERVGGRRPGALRAVKLGQAHDLAKQSLIWSMVGFMFCILVTPIALVMGIKSKNVAAEIGESWPIMGILGTIIGGLGSLVVLGVIVMIIFEAVA